MAEAPKSGRSLEPETLAAYVDGRLPPDERERVETALASDPESYEWLVQTMKAEEHVDEMVPKGSEVPRVPTVPTVPGVPRVRVLPFHRRRGVVVAAAGSALAIAAALLLVVRLQPAWWQSMWGPAVDPRFEKLVAAVGEERYVEGRLTGGFKYGPLRSVTRGAGDLSNENLALLAAAGQLQKAAQADPTPENLHAWGVAQLFVGDYDRAVRTLDSALRSPGGPTGYYCDLSAAYAARAKARLLPEDWPRALKAADEALTADPTALECLFNRAIALEGMQLRERAIEAWSAYLARDPASRWAEEANRRLTLLSNEVPKAENLDLFERNLRSTVSAGRAIALTPDRSAEAFDWLLRARIAGCDRTDPDPLPQYVAAELLRLAGDRLFVDLIAEAGRCQPGWTARWERSVELLGLIEQDKATEARTLFQAINAASDPRWLVQNLVIGFAHVRLMFRDRKYGELIAVTEDVLRRPSSAQYPVLCARLLYLQGVSQSVVGRFTDSLASYELAARKFQTANQEADYARALVDISSVMESEGQLDLAWDRLADALVAARNVDSRRLRIAAYSTAATLHAARDNFGAAAAFLVSMRDALGHSPPPVVVVVNRVDTAKAYIHLRRFHEAALELDAASATADTLRSDRRHSSLEASIAAARSQLAIMQGNASLALEYSDQAIGLTESDRAEQLVTYQLLRTQALGELGRTVEASQEISRAIAASRERRRASGVQARSGLQQLIQQTAHLVAGRLLEDQKSFDALNVLQDSQHEQLGTSFRYELPVNRVVDLLSQSDEPIVVVCLARIGAVIASWSISKEARAFARVPSARADEELYKLDVAVRAQQLEAVHASLRRLDQLLFDPHRPLLRRAERVIVVPDGATMMIPFGALASEWRRAGHDGVTVTLSPSLSVVSIEEPRPQTARLLAVGNESTGYEGLPALPNVSRELQQIASLYDDARVEMAPSLSVGGLRAIVSAYSIVHLAAHSVVDNSARSMPRMLLGPGPAGMLSGHAIRSLPLASVTTVILSSCSTAARGAEGIDPLSVATEFSLAGAASVIAAIWDVPDQAAVDLFRHIHVRLRQGDSAAAAVANTQDWAIASADEKLALASMSLASIESAIFNENRRATND